jgi:hypothetical protein
MTDITPPPELVQQWEKDWYYSKVKHVELLPYIAAQSAQYGADQELEACCEEFSRFWDEVEVTLDDVLKRLRTSRRPKPPSLKEQALTHFESYAATFETVGGDSDLIRRALEQLPE